MLSAKRNSATGCSRLSGPLLFQYTRQQKTSRAVGASVAARGRRDVISPPPTPTPTPTLPPFFPKGTEVLMAGLSVLMEPLFPISTLSQPIRLPLLIAFFHLLPAPLPLSLSLSFQPVLCACFGEAISLQQCSLSPQSHLSLTPIFVFAVVCNCLSTYLPV